ncbi:hypothetical protein LTR37_001262 [Vermiconidia calcicola]|uniref:Uncharacterized protein n=1 Tax=Vermiconidia calcicola TaxID=1690605 RepID=A0ACC3NXI1_9PEZI|nr:hypothetical protein LTR37_001262 [Vermiconidia calcicola]
MERVDIAYNGDVSLVVSGAVQLNVSSVVLGTTSKVFRAMLGPNFAEGQSIRTASAQRPAEIRLPNDDADAFAHATHHLSRTSDIKALKKANGSEPLPDLYEPLRSSQHRAARLLRDDIANVATEIGSLYSCEPYHPRTNAATNPSTGGLFGCPPRVGTGLFGGSIYTNGGFGGSSHPGGLFGSSTALAVPEQTSGCSGTLKAVRFCLATLVKAGVWKPRESILSLRDILDGVERLIVPDDVKSCQECIVKDLLAGFQDRIAYLKQRGNDVFSGVCLDCYRAGGRSRGECRFKHE